MIGAFWLTAVAIGISLINAAVQYRQARQAEEEMERERRSNYADPDLPHVTEHGPIPVVFGTVNLTGPNVVMVQSTMVDVPTTGIQTPKISFPTSRKYIKDTNEDGDPLGHQELFVHLVFCQGPVDEVVEFRSGSERLWEVESLSTADDDVYGSWDLREHYLSTGESLYYVGENEGDQPARGSGPAQMTRDSRGELDKFTHLSFANIAGWNDFRWMGGWPDQPIDSTLQEWARDDIPAYRGVFGCNGRVVWPFGGRLDDTSVIVRRRRTGSFGESLNATLASSVTADGVDNGGMNAVAIVEEVLTDRQWGMGTPREFVSDGHFNYASIDAAGPGMGLSMVWTGRETYGDFIGEILRHIDGALYIEPTTGKYVIRMIRDDYDLDGMVQQTGTNQGDLTKPIINIGPDQILGDVRETQTLTSELINEVTVIYPDLDAERDRSFTEHNAVTQRYHQPSSHEIRYPFINDAGLAARLAARDLAELSAPLRTFRIDMAAEAAEGIRPADVFVLTYPDYGIVSMVCRATGITGSNIDEQVITVEATQDVFAIGDAITAQPEDISLPDLREKPEPASTYVSNVPFWWEVERHRQEVNENEQPQFMIDADVSRAGRAMVAAWVEQPQVSNWDLSTSPVDGALLPRDGARPLSPIVEIGFTQPLNGETVTGALFSSDDSFAPRPSETLAFFEVDEVIVAARDWDLGLETATFDVGFFDTTPGYPTLEIDGTYPVLAYGKYEDEKLRVRRLVGVSPRRRIEDGDLIVRALPRIPTFGLMAEDEVDGDTVSIKLRMWTPYPPGRVRIDSSGDEADSSGSLVFSWSQRWRAGQQVSQTEDINVPPDEPDSGWVLRIYSATEADLSDITLLRAETLDASVTSYEYTGLTESEDLTDDKRAEVIVIKISGVRGGVESPNSTPRTIIRED